MPDKQRLICEIVTDQCISLSCNWESSKSFLPSSSSLLLHLWVGLMHYLLPSTALCLILVNRGTSEREPCLRLVLLHPHRLRGLDLGASIKLHNSLSNVAPIWLLSLKTFNPNRMFCCITLYFFENSGMFCCITKKHWDVLFVLQYISLKASGCFVLLQCDSLKNIGMFYCIAMYFLENIGMFCCIAM